MTKIVELIYSDLERRGNGESERDPIRRIEQWFEKDGTLVVERDPFKGMKQEAEQK